MVRRESLSIKTDDEYITMREGKPNTKNNSESFTKRKMWGNLRVRAAKIQPSWLLVYIVIEFDSTSMKKILEISCKYVLTKSNFLFLFL